jgi:hypothetical protein
VLVAISLASGQSSNKSLPELDKGSQTLPPETWEAKLQQGSKDKSSKASSVSLEDIVTTSGSIGWTEQHGSEACTGSTGREACASQAKINKVAKCS